MNIQRERQCKWCMIRESMLPLMEEVDYHKYCVHEGGHEWIIEEVENIKRRRYD